MIQDLTDAIMQSSDLPDAPPSNPVSLEYTGGRGRPKKVIDPDVLAAGMSVGGPTFMGELLDVSPRTVRRRALEQGLVEPGDPVYVDTVEENGDLTRTYTSSSAQSRNRNQGGLTNEQLDIIMSQLLELFPTFGRRMIDGYFSAHGHHIPRSRLEQSYNRVHGPSTATFGARRIRRRVYNVSAFNSLWHHDGQHGKCYQFSMVVICHFINQLY